ncbi:hypothetical protein [Nocardioides zhouii]|uniref:Uncharacterized protein n=1 Tax=Nocardioides zhouii TaxID=1168729 RepID=A0A4Q2T2L0_9ACTN|nr:hypothetical protein [Nocardioides zhouii]RYC12936.1 hypothetical protein EUA94_06815 [Nocardioides zhouii]
MWKHKTDDIQLSVALNSISHAIDEHQKSQSEAAKQVANSLAKNQPAGRSSAPAFALAISTILLSIVNAAILYWQTTSVQDQADATSKQLALSVEAQLAQSRIADAEFVAGINLQAGIDGLTIANTNRQPLREAALWFKESFAQQGHLQEFEGLLEGVPACASLEVNRDVLLANVQTSAGVDDDRFFTGSPDRSEAQVVVQAPSGSWYVVGDDGLFESSPPLLPDFEPAFSLRLLRASTAYAERADTYWEGFSSVATGSLPVRIAAGERVSGFGPQGALSRGIC